MKSFKEFLNEAKKEKTVVAAFGRFNPPSIGHKKLLEKMYDLGKKYKANNVQVFGSHSQDAKKNPLSFDLKMKYLDFYAPVGVQVMDKSNIKTPFEMVEKLAKDGFTKIIVVAGADRISEYQRAEKYAKENGVTEYEVVSAGDRDPDADGVEGMSASKMRKAAADGDFDSFAKGAGMPGINKDMYDSVRKGMGIK